MHSNRVASLFFFFYLLFSPLVAEAVVDVSASVVDVEGTPMAATAEAPEPVVRDHQRPLPAGSFVSVVPATEKTVNFAANAAAAAAGGLRAMTVLVVNGDGEAEGGDRIWKRAAGGNAGAANPLERKLMGFLGTTAAARELEEERGAGGRSEEKKCMKRTEKQKNVLAPMEGMCGGTKSEKKTEKWAPMGMDLGNGSSNRGGQRGGKIEQYGPMAKD
ncbi:hypothetical protein DFJ73DRAFT_764495 [Zopfochytrium polystomum]|nr:hypothetical protein DFJ73DRAFT_764495 [Zopfochytrium polystomum]